MTRNTPHTSSERAENDHHNNPISALEAKLGRNDGERHGRTSRREATMRSAFGITGASTGSRRRRRSRSSSLSGDEKQLLSSRSHHENPMAALQAGLERSDGDISYDPNTSREEATTHSAVTTDSHHENNPMSALEAKLEGNGEKHGPASREEATVQSAFTTSGSSTGSRRRRKSRSSSLSGDEKQLSGSHRRRRKSRSSSLSGEILSGSHHENPSMSALEAKLEGSGERHGPTSREEATIHSAFTTSGASTDSRRRRKSRSSSLSGEILMSGSHSTEDVEHPKFKGTRRGRRKSAADSLDSAIGQGYEGHHVSTAHHHHRGILKHDGTPHSGRDLKHDEHELSMNNSSATARRSGRRSSSPKSNQASISVSPGRTSAGQRFAANNSIESSPTWNHLVKRSAGRSSSPKINRASISGTGRAGSISPGRAPADHENYGNNSKRTSLPMRRTPDQPRRSQRSLSPRHNGGGGGESRALPRTNVSPRRVSGNESRPMRRRSREQAPGVQHRHSPERSLRGKRRVTMHTELPQQSRLHDSNSTGVMTAPSLERRHHSKSPPRLSGRSSGGVLSMNSTDKPKARSLSPATKRKSRPSALETLLGKEGREQEEKVKTSMSARPRPSVFPDEKPQRVKSDINTTGMMRMHNSFSTTGVTASSLGRRHHSKSPHRLSGRSSGVRSVNSADKPKARSLSPATKRKSRPSALETLLGKEGREQEEKVKTSMSARPRPSVVTNEKPQRVKSDVNATGMMRMHDSISTAGGMTVSSLGRRLNSKSPHRLSGRSSGVRSVSSADKPKARSLSPATKRKSRPSALETLLGKEGREQQEKVKTSMSARPRPRPPVLTNEKPQRVQSDTMGHRTGPKKNEKPKVRRYSHDNSRNNSKKKGQQAPTRKSSPTRKVLDSEVQIISLQDEKKLMSTPSLQSMFSTDDWGEAEFSEPFQAPDPAPQQRSIQRIPSKSHRMKLEEGRANRRAPRGRRRQSNPRPISDDPNDVNKNANGNPTGAVELVDSNDEESSSPFAVLPANTDRLVGSMEKWGKDAKNKSQH